MPGDPILPLSDEGIQILEQSCLDFSDAAKGKFGCTVVVHNVDFTAASVSGRNKGPDIRYTKQLSGGMKISVWKDDLTTHKVDAVVNAANEQLNHGGGLALALSRAGGPTIQNESNQFVRQNGIVPTGKVAVTRAGKLPCQIIIHAVGPQVPRNPPQWEIDAASPLLQEAIWNILTYTDHNNSQSVAIPAISSGIYNFPRDLCANIIVNTVISFSNKRKPAQSLEVRLVNNDDPSVQEMLRACQQILGPSDTRSGAMQNQSISSTKSTCPRLELGNVTLFLKEGEIQKETTDVIVNPIGSDLDLSLGYVSRAILEKAGKGIQDEVIRKKPWNVTNGTVIETKGHNLKSHAVFHTICDVQQSKTQILHNVITQCLRKTEGYSFSSISFPAIGTGKLGRSKEEVSQKMIHAVVEFADKYKGKKMEVYFVIYPTDTEKFQAFKKEMASAKQKSSRIPSKAVKNSGFYDERGTGTTPLIEFLTDSSEVLREAKEWTLKILHVPSGSVTIQNNHVIHFGQEEHEHLMSLQTALHVSITEFFSNGKCGIIINGKSTGVSCAALMVEAMLCKAQEKFAQAEENDLLHSVVSWQAFPGSNEPETNAALEKAYLAKNTDITVNGQNVQIDSRHRIGLFSLYEGLQGLQSKSYYQRTTIDMKNYGPRKETFLLSGLKIEKVERIENNALKQVFELNKRRISAQPKQLFQCVKAQYCELISRVGFQRDYAPPEEQKFGAGIYFTSDPRRALELWQDREEQYIYIIEAQVLTGRCTSQGAPQMIVPPSTADTQAQYDSVCNKARDTFVIFNGQQALPEYIYTCTINKH
uniref:Poly(ADP-ribose) polymerase family member 9 n=1 Tax=Astyanax mexicanus TaxID=7994 RepID=A0A3B1JFR0_ASTMX